MTQYIEEQVFRSCITRDSSANYPYFNKNQDNVVTLKPAVNDNVKKSNPLNFLINLKLKRKKLCQPQKSFNKRK